MKIKKLLPVIISLIVALSFTLSGCGGESGRYDELKAQLNSVAEGMTETFGNETCDFNLLREYISAWAKNNGVKVKENAETYIVLSNPATEGHKKDPSTTLQCSVNVADTEKSIYVASTALASLLGPEEHGKIDLIITELDGQRHTGAQDVDKKYIKGDNFINLQNTSDVKTYKSGAYTAKASITSKLKRTESKYSEAFVITMSMPEYTDPFNYDKKKGYPNPVEVIGGLLASTKSSGKLFDIASFECEAHDGYTPYRATATVVIDKNNVESFKKKFDKSYENMTEKFEKLESVFVYTLTETDKPSKVLAENTSNNLISLMYTLNTGVCLQNEETGLVGAASYIDSVDCSKDNLKLSITIRARDEASIDEVADIYSTTAGLCSTKCSLSEKTKIWSASEKNTELADYFMALPKDQEEGASILLKTIDNDFLAAKNPGINMITFSFPNSGRDKALADITQFLDLSDAE